MAEGGRQRRNAQRWGELVKQQMASGLSVPAFCRREGINAWTLYGWRSRLRPGQPRRPESRPAPAKEASSFDISPPPRCDPLCTLWWHRQTAATMMTMHDWILISISMDWDSGRLTVELGDSASAIRVVTAVGVRNLQVPRENPWGPSRSVNSSSIEVLAAGTKRLQIEMQSGDVIEVVAEQLSIPTE